MYMKVTIFLLCYNEEVLLPHTLKHYKNKFPKAHFVLVDNHSTDASCSIAKENGMEIRSFDTSDRQCERIIMHIRNTIWNDTDGWIIMCDMDEWLDISEDELIEEDENGTTIITTMGFNIVGDSKTIDLCDVDLCCMNKGYWDESFSKRVLFKAPDVSIHFWWGAHQCFPTGNIKYSEKKYTLKHYNYLGENYLLHKHTIRYDRNEYSRTIGMNGHYSNDRQKVIDMYNNVYQSRIEYFREEFKKGIFI